ncbi:hypothetical protein [Streptomyces lavendulae]|uniref:hypothetical protein n=1 Tax=Streptomyces lavendulae TaxID=1914 RepID=UPI0031F04FA8
MSWFQQRPWVRRAAVMAGLFALVVPATSSGIAHADSSCGDKQICIWANINYTGTKKAYTFTAPINFGCRNTDVDLPSGFRSLKLGAGTLAAGATQYDGDNCFVVNNREDTVSVGGTQTGNPETNDALTAFTAHSFSYLQFNP